VVSGGAWLANKLAGLPTSPADAAEGAAAWVGTPQNAEALPWGRWGAWDHAIDAIVTDPSERADLASGMVKRVVDAHGARAERRAAVADDALRLAGFMSRWGEYDVADPKELTDAQRRTAEALAGFPDVVAAIGWGLPGGERTLRRWLGIEPPTALEKANDAGTPRWLELRKLIANQQPPKAVMEAALEGLSPADRLETLSSLSLGAYRIVGEADAQLEPEDFEREVTQAGADALPWARQMLRDAVPLLGSAQDVARSDPAMAALIALVRAGEPIDPSWDDLVGFYPPDMAREILSAIPKERRQALALRWAQSLQPGAYAIYLQNVLPLMDLVGSKELAKTVRPWLSLGPIKNRAGLVPKLKPVLDALEGK
jgi:hypothetical protein